MLRGLYGYAVFTASVSSVPGDYNGNGIVDVADYSVWRDHLGQDYDLLNRDPSANGPINAADYTFWASHFGNTGSGAAARAAAPEPAGFVLLSLGSLTLVAWRASHCRSASGR
jgi:hypothetical protein